MVQQEHLCWGTELAWLTPPVPGAKDISVQLEWFWLLASVYMRWSLFPPSIFHWSICIIHLALDSSIAKDRFQPFNFWILATDLFFLLGFAFHRSITPDSLAISKCLVEERKKKTIKVRTVSLIYSKLIKKCQ